jgi:hypothetical protein
MPKPNFGETGTPNLPEEPEGWRILQERARNARDPRELEAVIAEINQLLTESERKASGGEGPPPGSRRRSAKHNSTTDPGFR